MAVPEIRQDPSPNLNELKSTINAQKIGSKRKKYQKIRKNGPMVGTISKSFVILSEVFPSYFRVAGFWLQMENWTSVHAKDLKFGL